MIRMAPYKLTITRVFMYFACEIEKYCRCDGGVSNITYLLRLMSQLAGKCIKRSTNVDATSLGAAYLAGLASGEKKRM